MKGQKGATIIVESERATQPARRGVIEEVLQENPPRFRVQWDDGRETIFSPTSGVARIEKRTKARSSSRP
jgi:Domain of unknown function (DUF1918)